MYFKKNLPWLFLSLFLWLMVGCTSLNQQGQRSFPELVTRDNETQVSIQLNSPTDGQSFTSLSIPVAARISSSSNVTAIILLWCDGAKLVTNLQGNDVNNRGDFTFTKTLFLPDEGTYYFWIKVILVGNQTVLSRPILIQAYTNVAKVAAPLFSPSPRESANPTNITISSITPGATIWWTTNNWVSLGSGSSPLTVSLGFGEHTLKAYATKEQYIQSDSVTGNYSIRVASPQINPPAGSYTTAQTISFTSTTTGATIVWSTNNWLSSSTSPLSLAHGIFIVKAYATRNSFFSSTNQWEYLISSSVATPIFTPESGTYESATTITASSATEGATIYLSTNGSTWIATNTITLPAGSWTLSGYAQNGSLYSLTNAKAYTITGTRVATPQFSPAGGTYPTNIVVSLSCSTPGATISWTTNNEASWHTSSSLNLSVGMYTLAAYATKAGLSTSLTNTISYTIADAIAPIPGGAIQVSNVQSSSAVVYWPAASDNSTPPSYLRYLLVYSTNQALINTLDKVTNPTSGVIPIGWNENTTLAVLSSLSSNTTYYVNIAVKDTSGNTALYTTSPPSFTTSAAGEPYALLTIIFSNWNVTRTLYIPGDHNNWDPNSVTLSHTAGQTSLLPLSNTVLTSVINRGATTTAIEFKIINNPNWNDQWSFSSWTRIGPITLYDSGRQIAITCDNNDVVTVLFNVENSTITATVEARP